MTLDAAAIRGLFDPPVAAAAGPPVDHEGFEAERRHVTRAVPKRRAEFTTVRACARDALAELGGPCVALVPNADRSPRWPAGFVGSLSHSPTLCAAVVARADDASSLGLDLELDGPLEPALFATVCAPAERRALAAMPPAAAALHAKRLFSAKEAFYKCQYPLTGAFLSCAQVELTFGAEGETFAVAEVDLAGAARDAASRVRGRCVTLGLHVVSAAWSLPSGGPSRFRSAHELGRPTMSTDETLALTRE